MPVFLSLGSEERPIRKFEAENISNYTALLLSQDGKTLYVGAREALFALNSNLSFLPGGEYQEVRGAGGWRGGVTGELGLQIRGCFGQERSMALQTSMPSHLFPLLLP